MKLHSHFAGLMDNAVNINDDRLRQLEKHVAALSGYLQESLATSVKGFLRQGSWAQRTIIKPLPGREFDADILVRMKKNRSWSDNPQEYLLALEAALRRNGRYRDRLTVKTRCIRISYAGECHVDLVPYIHTAGWFNENYITNRVDNRFEEINPTGFTEWLKGRDRVTTGNLRKSIRLLKYVRDYKATFDVPSIILTVIVGGRVSRLRSFFLNQYHDLPSTFTALVKSTDLWLQERPNLPSLPDPSCPHITFEHRIDNASYNKFRSQFHSYADTIQTAYDETRQTGSVRLWRNVFGEEFASR